MAEKLKMKLYNKIKLLVANKLTEVTNKQLIRRSFKKWDFIRKLKIKKELKN